MINTTSLLSSSKNLIIECQRNISSGSLTLGRSINKLFMANYLASGSRRYQSHLVQMNPLPKDEEMTEYPKRIDGLQINTVEDGFIIYQPEKDRVHYLNHTAVLILEFCNGRNSAVDIANLVKKTYSLADTPEAEVKEIVAKMEDEGLIQ